ncbi:DUF4253 domain-containing protein [Actinoplanes regularis]|uniref:DUF4253 domain-containing protein n=1 Tax=Actinoplanes regularis TaxID=52697 RepID=A0A238W1N5_9ACTN|nr:DUF4253 domain-containing protein [Actinoplanes regularis]GIE85338.1 hypothetical protein Are01nite_18180 [Actinoplanes regularis]SNR40515.1 protein of unknown function [Actinoplanes regularis]
MPIETPSVLAELELSEISEALTPGGVRLLSAGFPAERHDEVWRTLLRAHPGNGWYPVLGPDAHHAARRAGNYRPELQGPAVLPRALAVDPGERMDLLRRSHLEWIETEGGYDATDEYDPEVLARRLGEVAGPASERRAVTGPYPPDSVLLVPAAAGYEVPILVPGLIQPPNWFGAQWHPDLSPEDHSAVLRHWHRRYGAELYYTGGNELELAVFRPPATRLEVARCAIEQMIYCDDLSQKIGDVEGVAREQAGGHHWSFWWD